MLDHWTLWPPTPVSLDTLWLVIPGVVGLVECGVGLKQLVHVSLFSLDIVNATLCVFYLLQWFVQTSPSQPMEHHLYTVTPPSPEMRAPRLPTPVPLATRWLDWWWGRVVSVDGALEMTLSVLVRGVCCWTDVNCSPTAICPELPTLVNGMIIYSPSSSPRLEGTIATQSCNEGHLPSTASTRTCQTSMQWTGSSLTCNSKWLMFPIIMDWYPSHAFSCVLCPHSICYQWSDNRLYWYNIRSNDRLLLQHWISTSRISHDNLSC